jgi:hypothetical protein
MIDKIEQERKIDIYNFVLQMRRERSLMVQTVVCYHNKRNQENMFFFLHRDNMYLYIDHYWNIIYMEIQELKLIYFDRHIQI